MKKYTFIKSALTCIIYVIFIHLCNLCFSQNYEWAKSASGTFNESGNDIVIDDNGNIYVTGYACHSVPGYDTSAIFGVGEPNETTIEGASLGAFYIAKYDNQGTLLWAKQALGTAQGEGLAVDNLGYIFATGSLRNGVITFGSGEVNETSLTASNGTVFIAKYSPNGELVWVKQAQGWSEAINSENTGFSFITGYFIGSAIYGADETNETTLTSTGWTTFIAKYDNNGLLQWAKQTSGEAYGVGISTDNSNNCYITGRFLDSVIFGLGEINETIVTSSGNFDIFLAKYDSNGQLMWAKSSGGLELDYGFGVAVDNFGNCYSTGHFEDSATFALNDTNTTLVVGAGRNDVFISKYDQNGQLLWVKSAGGTAEDYGKELCLDDDGNCYVIGEFSTLATFGLGDTNETVLNGSSIEAAFVAKYNKNGELQWAKQASTQFLSIVNDNMGNNYITGRFAKTSGAVFDSINITNSGTYPYTDFFVVKLSDGDTTLCTTPVANFSSATNNLEINLSDSSSDATTWYWDFDDNNNTDTTQNSSYTYTNPGTYFVCLTVINNCGIDTYCDSISVLFTGIMNNDFQNRINVFPNPFNNFAIMKFNSQIPVTSFILYDILGTEVKRIETIKTKQIQITRDNLPAGMYFYKLKSQEEIIGIGKVIIS